MLQPCKYTLGRQKTPLLLRSAIAADNLQRQVSKKDDLLTVQ